MPYTFNMLEGLSIYRFHRFSSKKPLNNVKAVHSLDLFIIASGINVPPCQSAQMCNTLFHIVSRFIHVYTRFSLYFCTNGEVKRENEQWRFFDRLINFAAILCEFDQSCRIGTNKIGLKQQHEPLEHLATHIFHTDD